jgi:hypothetical protein
MADRVSLVLAGLVGLAIVWVLDHEDQKQSGRRTFKDHLSDAWGVGNPFAGGMGIGWLLAGSLGLIVVGLFSFSG